jgi:hypothetical protein
MNTTDGSGKGPDAALRFILRRCSVRQSTPRSSRFARLACGPFYEAVRFRHVLMAVCANATGGSGGSLGAAMRPVVSASALAFLLFAGGCAGLPPIKSLDPAMKPAILEECRKPFLPAKYRLVHTLEALLPDGGKATAIGVLVADPRDGSFRSVLMTIEGWVLFDIESGAIPTVHRAVPPFEAPAFARRMAEDIGLAFFAPNGEPALWGQAEKGFRGCRFERPGGGFVDLLTGEGGVREIRLYGTGQELLKRVEIPILESTGLADELEIRGEGWPSYVLRLRLIEAEAVEVEQRTP